MKDIDLLVEKSLSGEKLATARLISIVERGDDAAPSVMEKIYPHSGSAYYIGVTGPPGVGKSTITDRLVSLFCGGGYSVGIVAVDPCSPFSGGALLGDRVRMHVKSDWDVFFRSMSAGRVMGGLAKTTKEASRILDAGGKEIIIVETVGVGQSELDITQATDTVVVVLMPDSGDAVQMMKAGLMEIADIFVVNKADRPGAENLSSSVEGMLDRASQTMEWKPPVLLTAASLNRGIDRLYDTIWNHARFLKEDSRLEKRRKAQMRNEMQSRIEGELLQMFRKHFGNEEELNSLAEKVYNKGIDPQTAARTFLENGFELKKRRE